MSRRSRSRIIKGQLRLEALSPNWMHTKTYMCAHSAAGCVGTVGKEYILLPLLRVALGGEAGAGTVRPVPGGNRIDRTNLRLAMMVRRGYFLPLRPFPGPQRRFYCHRLSGYPTPLFGPEWRRQGPSRTDRGLPCTRHALGGTSIHS